MAHRDVPQWPGNLLGKRILLKKLLSPYLVAADDIADGTIATCMQRGELLRCVILPWPDIHEAPTDIIGITGVIILRPRQQIRVEPRAGLGKVSK